MCGIAGSYYLDTNISKRFNNHSKIVELLKHRGPDHQAFHQFNNCTFYHSRLSIIDTSDNSNQPYLAGNKQSGMVFNGEIFNYKELRPGANSDVEVLFDLFEKEKTNCLNKLNGFFAFAHYDEANNSFFLVRDRLGVKPLYFYLDKEKFIFASELKPLMELAGAQELNKDLLYSYFRLNYCSGHETIFKNVYRMLPGHYIEIKNKEIELVKWYQPQKTVQTQKLDELLNDSVRLRLVADVPVGSFLSGGMDSSIISALAIKHKPDLQTFSIGFKDESYFDETDFAEQVSRHINSNHSTFKLSENDFIENIEPFLQGIDEPFADSSAFNFYMLSKLTAKKVKVALSGDGADELFKGYYKHKAIFLKSDFKYRFLADVARPLMAFNTGSRNSRIGNIKRRITKFNSIQNLSETETFKYLASISTDTEVCELLSETNPSYFDSIFKLGKTTFNREDLLDLKIVLADDMLVKADRFSMRHGIEIRNPFLDYRVVEYALNLNRELKINSNKQKIILHKEFSHLLPKSIFERAKKGFELPLQKWLSTSLQSTVMNDWLSEEKIKEEKLLNYSYIQKLNTEMCSSSPEDSASKLWAIIVFESWLQNFNEYIKPNA
ncbi:MAG: asparagine synthase (glutamine-hydrolyzing) [Bacteroidetes bacterium]|nr:asparagine synthase (glutamine-hydrolyzing) [Bacteroidota bacterium]